MKSEIPFETPIAVVLLPGEVINKCVSYTRGFALQKPPIEKGGFLQTDDGILWDHITNTVLNIRGKPLNPTQLYSVAMYHGNLMGMDNITPLLEYKASRPANDPSIHIPADSCIEAKEILVSTFSKQLLFNMVNTSRFSEIDTDGDEHISKDELRIAALNKYGSDSGVGDMVVNNLFSVADFDGNGFISRRELMELSLSVLRNVKYVSKGAEEVLSIGEIMEETLVVTGRSFDATEFFNALSAIDKDHSGYISRREYDEFLRSRVTAANIVI